ncbi:MAG: glycosyltransferase family 39 protein [Anaerolineae bacterium]
MRAWVVALLLVVVAFLPRAIGLAQFATWDELQWTHATLRFWRAVDTERWPRTYIIGQPAIVSMWLGSAPLTWRGFTGGPDEWETIGQASRPSYSMDDMAALGDLADYWRDLPIATAVAASLAVGAIYLLARRLFGARAALVAGILVAFDPLYLAHSRLVTLDAVMASLMLLSVLTLLIYVTHGRRWPWLVASGVLGGLAALQKTPGTFLLGFVALVCLLVAGTAGVREFVKQLPRVILTVLGWAAAAVVTYVAAWPAMWTTPVETLTAVFRTLRAYGPAAFNPTFFLGEPTTAPGVLFYPLVFLFKTTPLTLLGLALLGWLALSMARANWCMADGGKAMMAAGLLVLYAVLYGVFLSIAAGKFDRYLLPALLPLNVAAGVGLAWSVSLLAPLQRYLGRTKVHLGSALLGVALLIQSVHVLAAYPYFLAWYNPIVGGQQAAVGVLPLGMGEGVEQAAHYLAALPNANKLKVATWSAVGLAPWFQGEVIMPDAKHPWQSADYAVVYITDVQRGEEIARQMEGREPVFVGHVGSMDYVWVYQLRGSQ